MRHLLRPTHLTVLLLLTSLLLVGGCDKKRMSYVDMIKQEEKEVKHFTDSLGIRIIKELPADLITRRGHLSRSRRDYSYAWWRREQR